MSSHLDPGQIIKLVADEVNNAINVNVVAQTAAGSTIEILDGNGGTDKVSVTSGKALKVDASATVQPVSATSLPLPTGASTVAKQPALGVAGTASSDVITVQGIASMTALKVDASSTTQPVSAASLPLPTGASTSALQTTANTSLASIDTKTPSVGQAAMAASRPVVIASNQSAVPVSGTVTSNIGTTNGLALDATISTTQPRKLQDGSGNAITSSVVGSNRGIHVAQLGYTNSEFIRNDYTSVNVTTSAYVQLIASTSNEYQELRIFDSSGQTLKLAIGAAASEVDKFLIIPGGYDAPIKFRIASGSRISIKAVSATASTGEIDISLFG